MEAVALNQYRDETIMCCTCSRTFVFSARQQEDFARRGFENKPKRCPKCREAKKQNGNGARSKRDQVARHLNDRDLLLEMCKAVNELQVLVAHRLDRIEEKIEQLAGTHGDKEKEPT